MAKRGASLGCSALLFWLIFLSMCCIVTMLIGD